jgi:hypothetical protein
VSIVYTTREDVASSQDIRATAYAGRDIDSAIESGARSVESLVHRVLYPWVGTRYFDFPNGDSPSYRIRFGKYNLISATVITNGDGTVISNSNTFLNPQDGPPFTHIEVNRGTSAFFTSGSTNQRAVAITGTWGDSNVEQSAGTVTEPLDLTETGIDGSAMPLVGIGSLVRVDSERMRVTGKSWLTTSQTGTLAASNAAQVLTVADGTAFVVDDILLIEAERVRVLDIAGNSLIVKRAVDGTTLAAHTSAAIFAPRSLTVERGVAGTTAATHLTSAPAFLWAPPSLAGELNRAYAVNTLLQRQSGYGRVETDKRPGETPGRSIAALEQDVRANLGAMVRTRAV